MKSRAKTVQEYLAALPAERRAALTKLRAVIRKNLPKGYQESMTWGLPTYEVPLARYPKTYNGQPLLYAGLASQKQYMALYLTSVWSDPSTGQWFRARYQATGKKLDMGKSCVRFKKLEDLPLEVIAEVIARTPVEKFLRQCERARGK